MADTTRLSQLVTEVVGEGEPEVRVSQLVTEVINEGEPETRFTQLVVEVIIKPLVPLSGSAGLVTVASSVNFNTGANISGTSNIAVNLSDSVTLVPFLRIIGTSSLATTVSESALYISTGLIYVISYALIKDGVNLTQLAYDDITRMTLDFDGRIIDSDVVGKGPDKPFDWTADRRLNLALDLLDPNIDPKMYYRVKHVVYSSDNPNGLVWGFLRILIDK